jgi:hypothetical protein
VPELRLYVTIDTEPDCDPSWNRSDPLEFTSITEGIPGLLRPIWTRQGVSPIYFVSPEVLNDKDSCSVLRDEINKGAIIGAHLHSEYIAPDISITDPAGKLSLEFPHSAHCYETEKAKINNLTKLIKKKFGVRPVWYRAARYGADLDTIRALSELGYKYDSSVTPGIDWSGIGGPDHSKAPIQPYIISSTDLYTPAERKYVHGITEYPITIHGKRFGYFGKILPNSWLFYRWLRPTHMTIFEQKALVKKLIREYTDPVFVLMFHSMEVMINRSPFVRNKIMQKRFLSNLEKIISYIHMLRDC